MHPCQRKCKLQKFFVFFNSDLEEGWQAPGWHWSLPCWELRGHILFRDQGHGSWRRRHIHVCCHQWSWRGNLRNTFGGQRSVLLFEFFFQYRKWFLLSLYRKLYKLVQNNLVQNRFISFSIKDNVCNIVSHHLYMWVQWLSIKL